MSLKTRLKSPKALLAPGVYDSLSALIAVKTGFEALYLSGAGFAYTRLGRPDIGLVSMAEMANHVAYIRDCVEVPLIVDADTGFGNALNMQRCVRHFEKAGANALQIEDQTFPKRCGHLQDKSIVTSHEMVQKIKAAVDARDKALIIARTDAIATDNLAEAITRAHLYKEAGADVIFIEAPRSREDLQAIVKANIGVPLMANMVEGGKTPPFSLQELEEIGFSLVVFSAGVVRAVAKTTQDFYSSLARHGTTEPYRDKMYNFSELADIVGTNSLLTEGKKYD